jgi:hypothetical protein
MTGVFFNKVGRMALCRNGCSAWSLRHTPIVRLISPRIAGADTGVAIATPRRGANRKRYAAKLRTSKPLSINGAQKQSHPVVVSSSESDRFQKKEEGNEEMARGAGVSILKVFPLSVSGQVAVDRDVRAPEIRQSGRPTFLRSGEFNQVKAN